MKLTQIEMTPLPFAKGDQLKRGHEIYTYDGYQWTLKYRNTMTTDEAFSEMIHKKGMHTKLNRTAKYMTWLRDRNKKGAGISLEAKIKMLQNAGYEITMESEWFSHEEL